MWSNIRDINKMMDEPPKPRHPEAPAPGDEVMYVDLSREKLEGLYKQDDDWYTKRVHTLFFMEDSVMYPGKMLGQLAIALETLGWDYGDDVAVEIAGTSVYEIDGAGTKWAPVKGTRKYDKDAFIVIKNLDRNPTVSSQPNPELKQHHS